MGVGRGWGGGREGVGRGWGRGGGGGVGRLGGGDPTPLRGARSMWRGQR